LTLSLLRVLSIPKGKQIFSVFVCRVCEKNIFQGHACGVCAKNFSLAFFLTSHFFAMVLVSNILMSFSVDFENCSPFSRWFLLAFKILFRLSRVAKNLYDDFG
jgi:hypothetical protein